MAPESRQSPQHSPRTTVPGTPNPDQQLGTWQRSLAGQPRNREENKARNILREWMRTLAYGSRTWEKSDQKARGSEPSSCRNMSPNIF